jgi:acetyl-CoA carboxylase carboxyl transferase subunit beta
LTQFSGVKFSKNLILLTSKGNSTMAWLSREPLKLRHDNDKKNLPDGIWQKCSACQEIILTSDFQEKAKVCSACGHHHRLTIFERLALLSDENSFQEWDKDLQSSDPLHFSDGKPYHEKLKQTREKTGRNDAILTGECKLESIKIGLGIMDFFWMGGSMGSVVGERITRLFVRACDEGLPVILVSSSGGARMHEGLISLMQMAKTCAAISLFKEKNLPYISLLCDPTTGGVAASFSMLGDINLSEPKATIGFAGRRVIESTTKQTLPDDFQTAEFCLKHGTIDKIVKRSELKKTLAHLLRLLQGP